MRPKSIRFPIRFLFAITFCVINFVFAGYIALSKVADQKKNVSHLVLLILAGNLMLYLLYYIIRKSFISNLEHEHIQKNKRRKKFCSDKLSMRINAGTFFAILSFLFAIIGKCSGCGMHKVRIFS